MHVLVADDDPDVRLVVTMLLGRRGWRVTAAESGEASIELLRHGTEVDVLVLDQSMPPGSGLDVVTWLRARGDRTPAVLFTGYTSALDAESLAGLDVSVLDKVAVMRLPDLIEELASPG